MEHDKSMKRLIVNADDLGLSRGIDEGILQTLEGGFVRSVTALAGGPSFAESLERVSLRDGASIGIHLNLTGVWDRPSGDAPACFFQGRPGPLLAACLAGRVDLAFAERCLRSQIETFLRRGRTPTHLDGHHHVHVFPGIARLSAGLAAEYGIPAARIPRDSWNGFWACPGDLKKRLLIHGLTRRAAARFQERRIRHTDHFFGFGLMGRTDYCRRFLKILDRLRDGTTEIMVHPGLVEERFTLDSYTQGRRVETDFLAGRKALERAKGLGIRLISYQDLAG
jgi:predicted glycoside hydrolase/deacetylase ChbG (UPF0249 family)